MFTKDVRLKVYGEMDEPKYFKFDTEVAARKFIDKTCYKLRKKNKDGFIDLMIGNFVIEHRSF